MSGWKLLDPTTYISFCVTFLIDLDAHYYAHKFGVWLAYSVYWLDCRPDIGEIVVRFLREQEIYLLSQTSLQTVAFTLPPIPWVLGFIHRVKVSETWSWTEMKDEWSCTSTPSCAFVSCTGRKKGLVFQNSYTRAHVTLHGVTNCAYSLLVKCRPGNDNLSSPTQFVKLNSLITRQLGYKHTFRQNCIF